MNQPRETGWFAKLTGIGSSWQDLLYTHETRRDVAQPATPVENQADNEAPQAPQTLREKVTRSRRRAYDGGTLFGEILDFMLAPLLLVWPLSIAITFIVARSLANAPFDRVLDDRTLVLAEQVKEVSGKIELNLPKAAREFLRADEEDQIFFQVLGPNQQLIAGDSDLPSPTLYDFPDAGNVKRRNETFRGKEVRVAFMYANLGPRANGAVLVQVAETLDKRSRLANEIIKGVILPQILILPLSVILVWVGLKRGLASLTQLRDRIDQRQQNDLSPINPAHAPEEVAPLVESFNEMMSRLNQTVQAQRRFFDDAAHQMKTPLAGLQTQAELALRQNDPEELRASLRQLARSANQSARLVSQLLALARAEHLRAALPRTQLNLTKVAREASADWVTQAIARQIDLGFEAPEVPVYIQGHAVLLRELINNLIDNALKYSGNGGTVTVKIHSALIAGGRLEVEDEGPGIASAEQAHIFDRFYRVLGNESDGSGLGLAIVKEIADQHGAQIRVMSNLINNPDRMPHGTKISIVFPT